MEKIFESKFMVGLQNAGQKIGSNKFLSALQAAMMSLMGIIMVGAVSQILVNVGTMLKLFTNTSNIYNILYMPYQYTMNSLALWVVGLLAYNYAKNLKMKSPMMNVIDAMVCFLLVAGPILVDKTGISSINMTYLGAQGMFIGFLIVFISVHIEKICIDRNIRIKMPDMVPQSLQDSFSSIIPLLISVIFFLVISTFVTTGTNGAYTLTSGFMKIIGYPLATLTSTPGMFILGFFAALLWGFGIHGTMILVPIVFPLLIQDVSANAAAHAAGHPITFYPVMLFGAIALVGGTGNTLPLALFGLRSKSKQISAVSKIAAVPGWFNINEPMTFGMPIMYNPILIIPYILSIQVVMLITFIGYKSGFIMPSWIVITALLPMGFGNYLGTLHWQNALWDYLMIIPAAIIWYPFFKVYEKQLIIKEEKLAEQEAAELDEQEAVKLVAG